MLKCGSQNEPEIFLKSYQCLSLTYSEFLQNSYAAYRHLPGFVLLESTDQSLGRYDILSAYPYDRIKLTKHSPDIVEQLKLITQRLAIEESDLALPFQGGAIGYIAYDLGAYLAQLELISQPSFEDLPLLDLGFYDWAIIADHHLKKVTLFAAHRVPSTAAIVSEMAALWTHSKPITVDFKLHTKFHPVISKQKYENAFGTIHKALKMGRSYQVNFTQPFNAHFEGDTWGMYQRVSKKNPLPFSAFMKTPEVDIVSFSPERFLLFDKGVLLTSPIKGTIGRDQNPVLDSELKAQLRRCEKNRAENVMIVDLLRNDLGKIAKPGSVEVSNLCSVQSFHSVHHLVSDIRAQCLEGIAPFEAFLSCFPGGSITGAPKLEAMRLINEQEHYARGLYCGSLGYFSLHGRFDTNIAIRTVVAKDGVLHLAAGGGLVIDSLCEEEYQECLTKIKAITDVLSDLGLDP